jgi:hypothetical protein
LASVVAGCGSSAMESDDGGVDAAVSVDLSMSGDMTAPPTLTGTQVATGFQLQLLNVTDDDTVVFSSATTNKAAATLAAVPAAGGAPTTIDASWNSAITFPSGVVVTWDNVLSDAGTLNVWTKAGGLKMLSTAAPTNVLVGVSRDGQNIFYASGSNSTGTLGDLFLAKTDGTGAKQILSQKATTSTCQPLGFFTDTRLVISYCNDASDAAIPTATVASVDVATGTPTTLYTNARSDWRFAADPAGTQVFTIDDMDNLKSIPIAGGAVTTVEANVASGFVSKDGTAFDYVTKGGALKRVTLAALTSPTILVASNIHGFQPGTFLSTDGTLALVYNMQTGTTMDSVQDLYLVSTATPGAPVTIDSTAETQLYGDPISPDNSRVVFFTDIFNGVGTMKSASTAGGTATTVAPKVWKVLAVSGTKYLFNDHYVGDTTGNGRADLHVTDVSMTGTGTLLANAANSDSIYLTHDHKKVIYLYNAQQALAGIYAAPIP